MKVWIFRLLTVEVKRNDWTKEQMKQADLIVVNFSQTSQGLDHFFRACRCFGEGGVSDRKLSERCCL